MLKRIFLVLVWLMLSVSPFFSSCNNGGTTIKPPSNSSSDKTSSSNSDDCIQLNTDIPWVWKKICEWNATSSFWSLMWGLMKLLINFVVAVAFIALIASWVMMMFSGVSQSTAWKWKELLKKVVIWIILLWLSWIILHTLNPNFFK